MQRIRPAVLWPQEHIGLRQALASEWLQTDCLPKSCGTSGGSRVIPQRSKA
jgi:hypothetical protein